MSHPILRMFDGTENTAPDLQDDVKELQTDLNRFGFNLPVNGTFDDDTEAAVVQFQKDHNLDADGIVGPLTWAALTETEAPASTDDDFPTTISNSNANLRAHFTEALKVKAFINAGAKKIGV